LRGRLGEEGEYFQMTEGGHQTTEDGGPAFANGYGVAGR